MKTRREVEEKTIRSDMKSELAAIPAVKGPRTITAQWAGSAWCLCHGEWIICVDGEKVELPDEVRNDHMNTYGTYSYWHFTDGWDEAWESYEDGLDFDPWLEANMWWVQDLDLTADEQRRLYDVISEEDWRHQSCGGCI